MAELLLAKLILDKMVYSNKALQSLSKLGSSGLFCVSCSNFSDPYFFAI